MPETIRLARIVWDEIPPSPDGDNPRQVAYARFKAQPGNLNIEPTADQIDTLTSTIEEERRDTDIKACVEALRKARDELTGYAREELGEEL